MNQAEKSERAREAICLAARQLFAEKGYDTTTMQDIVRTSGMSKGAIYHHSRQSRRCCVPLLRESGAISTYLLKTLLCNLMRR